MPEQLTKHPEVTLQVLRSAAGARCGDGAAPEILTRCPAERFCKLPGGELCVYGIPEASRMTQFSAADWRALAPAPTATTPSAAPSAAASSAAGLATDGALTAGGLGLLGGLLLGAAAVRLRDRRTPRVRGPSP